MNPETESAQKLRGGYYTSSAVARWLCAWAIRDPAGRVLEPSCGDGQFLTAAASRFVELGLTGTKVVNRITGVEIVSTEAELAAVRLSRALGVQATKAVKNQDFFSWWQAQRRLGFDAVIGNPPFIRYQSFPEPHRTRAMQIMQGLGLSPNRLTNIWVPFVAAAACSLKTGGRLALVLPAELLQVSYAAQLRSFLTDRFSRIDIVACNELFFERAEQEVVLVLADGAVASASEDNVCHVAMTETARVAAITSRNPAAVLAAAQQKTIRHDSEKWLKYFLNQREIALMRHLRSAEAVTVLSSHASVDVGVVTGRNEFFVLTGYQAESLGVQEYTTPLVSRSAQLKGARIDGIDWRRLSAAGDRVHLLHILADQTRGLSAAVKRYIREGESKEFHKGYKCSIRDPWYAVPSVWTPDAFMLRQIYDFPRIVLNRSGSTSTDTIHRMRSRTANPERIIANTYTWLTAASAEIEGRSYGGGVLELEPTEAERLLMPAKLNGAMPVAECDRLTRAGRIDEVLEENGRTILREHMGLSASDCVLLKGIWVKMRDRRMARRRTAVPQVGEAR